MGAGDPVFISTVSGTLPAALTANTVYYAGTILTNSFTLHLTKAAGVAGTGVIALADNGSGTLTGNKLIVVAGMRSTQFSINGEETDITNKDSTSQWRELLAGAGMVNMSVSASGVFQDDSNVIDARAAAVTKATSVYSLTFESGDEYYGLFQITSCEQAGEYNGEVTYSLSLENAGVVTLITNA